MSFECLGRRAAILKVPSCITTCIKYSNYSDTLIAES